MKSTVERYFAILLCALVCTNARAQSTGAIDTSFGSLSSWAVTDGAGLAATPIGIDDLIVLADGKVLALTLCRTNSPVSQAICLLRWNPSGASLDASFGDSGMSVVATLDPFSSSGRMAVRPDGRIFVVWSCQIPGAPNLGLFPPTRLCTAMVNENGIGFDVTYGVAGQSLIPLPSGYNSMSLTDVAIRGDDSLLVGAVCTVNGSDSSVCVTRLTRGGLFDLNFGVNNWLIIATTPPDFASDARFALLGDGQFLVSGRCSFGGQHLVCTRRFSQSGALQATYDTSWNGNAVQVTSVKAQGEYFRVTGTTQPVQPVLVNATRRRAFDSGAADTSYGGVFPTTGSITINIQSNGLGSVDTASILRDGSVFVHGTCDNLSTQCSARLNQHGTLDSSYGVNGRFQYPGVGNPFPFATELPVISRVAESERYIYVGGSCRKPAAGSHPCVRRYFKGVSATQSCSMDIDGDGRVLPTTDGLILARAMQGLRGAAVLSGATNTGATRTTWADVLFYLNDQCKMNLVP